MTTDRGDEQPRDPIIDLQYGDTAQARAGFNAASDQRDVEREIAKCQRFLKRFGQQNPDISENQAAIDAVTKPAKAQTYSGGAYPDACPSSRA
jgi:hypothetical protein